MAVRICLSAQIYPPEVGGVATAAQRLAGNLTAAGYEVHVVTPCQVQGPAAIEVRSALEQGVHVHRVCHDHAGPQEVAFALRALVRQLDEQSAFALFHGFFLTAVYPCVSAVEASGTPRPIIASIRGNDALTLKNHPLTRAAILAGLRKANWITSVNQAYIDLVMADVDIAGRCSVIRNSVKSVPEMAETWQLDARNRGVVGLVGQLRKVKDIPLLVRAYAQIPAALRRRLILAGYFVDAAEEEWTNALIREFALEAEVQVTGEFPQREVFDHLRSMHVYVQSSAFEGLPNALLEAASLGLPLVATSVGGMEEVLTDGENALLVPHGDPVALATAIARVLSNDALAERLSLGARRLVSELSPERELADWLALYARLIQSSSSPSVS
jgi:L-malate glycosyltransferase